MANVGRPSLYSDDLASLICSRIAEGESLRSICRDTQMPCMTAVFTWLRDKPKFAEQYTRAREAQAEAMADELIEIADNSASDMVVDEEGNERINHEVVARAKLRIDTRKWIASKLLPKKYGDKVAVGGADDLPPIKADIDPTDAVRRLAFLLAKAAHEQPKDGQ